MTSVRTLVGDVADDGNRPVTSFILVVATISYIFGGGHTTPQGRDGYYNNKSHTQITFEHTRTSATSRGRFSVTLPSPPHRDDAVPSLCANLPLQLKFNSYIRHLDVQYLCVTYRVYTGCRVSFLTMFFYHHINIITVGIWFNSKSKLNQF